DSASSQRESDGQQTGSSCSQHPAENAQRGVGGLGGDGERSQSDSGRSRSHEDNPSSDSPDYMASAARIKQRKEQDERRRAPGIWLPGSHDFDRDPEPGDDTEFGVDGPVREYASRQLGLRLRPKQFERLLEMARLYGV